MFEIGGETPCPVFYAAHGHRGSAEGRIGFASPRLGPSGKATPQRNALQSRHDSQGNGEPGAFGGHRQSAASGRVTDVR